MAPYDVNIDLDMVIRGDTGAFNQYFGSIYRHSGTASSSFDVLSDTDIELSNTVSSQELRCETGNHDFFNSDPWAQCNNVDGFDSEQSFDSELDFITSINFDDQNASLDVFLSSFTTSFTLESELLVEELFKASVNQGTSGFWGFWSTEAFARILPGSDITVSYAFDEVSVPEPSATMMMFIWFAAIGLSIRARAGC